MYKTSSKHSNALILSYALVSVLAVTSHVAANAADVLPTHLIGTWATGESLYAGTTEQNEFYLLGDSYGIAVGSAPGKTSGPADGKQAPRAIMGFPVRATLVRDRLTVRPYLPAQEQATLPPGTVISCQYGKTSLTLTCVGPDKAVFVMKRRDKTVPTEAANAIEALRLQSTAEDHKAGLPSSPK